MEKPQTLLELTEQFDEDIELLMHNAIRRGDSVHQHNKIGYSLLMLATFSSQSMPARVLIEAGANPNEKYCYQGASDYLQSFTPLMFAVADGIIDTVKLLIENGAEVDFQNAVGDTALFIAAVGNHLEKVKILLASGADYEIANQDGMTPVMAAARKGHMDVVVELVHSGANINQYTSSNLRIISLAKSANNNELVTFLESTLKKNNTRGTQVESREMNSNKPPRIPLIGRLKLSIRMFQVLLKLKRFLNRSQPD